jgi:hypothetical protein
MLKFGLLIIFLYACVNQSHCVEVQMFTDQGEMQLQLMPLIDIIFDCILKVNETEKMDFFFSIANLKMKLDELSILCDKIQENPIRIIDLIIMFAQKSDLIINELVRLSSFKDFNQLVQLLVDLIKQKILCWESKYTSTTKQITQTPGTTTPFNAQSSTSTVELPTTISTTALRTTSVNPTTTTTQGNDKKKIKKINNNLILLIFLIFLEVLYIDPIFCSNRTVSECSIPQTGSTNPVGKSNHVIFHIIIIIISLLKN